MEETFYGVLGIDPDADEQTIVHAFRERVKSRHPDVNDSADAAVAFKRLQTARCVLTDESERERYDRLGHVAYLRQCDDCPGWDSPDDDAVDSATPTGSTSEGTAAAAAHRYTDGGTETTVSRRTPPSRQGSSAAVSGTATDYYRPGQRTSQDSTGPVDVLVGLARSLGVWAVIHVLVVLSAVVTAWVLLSWGALRPLSLVLATFLVASALAVSALHISVRVYP